MLQRGQNEPIWSKGSHNKPFDGAEEIRSILGQTITNSDLVLLCNVTLIASVRILGMSGDTPLISGQPQDINLNDALGGPIGVVGLLKGVNWTILCQKGFR